MSNLINEKVRNFYNKTPFPDYELERFSSKEDLKTSVYPFAKILDRSIKGTVIDVGCGTGQLAAYLSLRRKVMGIDFSDSSINKAKKLKEKLKLNNLTLEKVNIMNLNEIKKLGKFDNVLCLGVLHHTENPYLAFKNILHLVRTNGNIAIGLYNKIGRIPLKIRKFLAKTIFNNNQKVKDYFIRMQIGDIKDKERARGWWNDQYNHPHESSHTIGEVLKWFRNNKIDFIQNVPSYPFDEKTTLEITGVWKEWKEVYPYMPLRIFLQLSYLFTTGREGGYWITFGRLK